MRDGRAMRRGRISPAARRERRPEAIREAKLGFQRRDGVKSWNQASGRRRQEEEQHA
jgi:hypothetical protein